MLKIEINRGARWPACRAMGCPPSPAVARCYCGGEVELADPLDNQCPKCGRWFNMSGQEVTPSFRCDESGEPADIW